MHPLGSRFSSRGWTYATTAVTLASEHLPESSNPDSTAYLDTGYRVIFVHKHLLLKRLPSQKINTMSTPLKVRDISIITHKPSKFLALSLYFPGKNNVGNLVYVLLQCEIHLADSFRINLLIGNNIISPEAIVIDLEKKTALIGACRVTMNVNAKQQDQFLAKRLFTS